jgi:hypothetical protein
VATEIKVDEAPFFLKEIIKEKQEKGTKRITKSPMWLFPNGSRREYSKKLLAMARFWQDKAKKVIIPKIQSILDKANKKRPELSTNIKTDEIKLDDYIDDIDKLMSRYEEEVDKIDPNILAAATFAGSSINNFNKEQWLRISNSIVGVPLKQKNAWKDEQLKAFIKENTALITKLKTETKENIESILLRGAKEGLRANTIKKQILEGTKLKKGVFRKVRTRAKLIARDQTNKLNAQLTQLRQTEAGVSLYEWSTALDERVRGRPGGKYASSRPTHWALEGKIGTWNNSTIYADTVEEAKNGNWKQRSSIQAVELHGGQDYNCRCINLPIMESIVF